MRFNKLNLSQIEIAYIPIMNIGSCDNFDFNLTASKLYQYEEQKLKQIDNIRVDVENKLKEVEKVHSIRIQMTTSFGWLQLLYFYYFYLLY